MVLSVNVTIADGENHTSLVGFNFEDGLTFAQLDGIAPILAGVVQDLIEGSVRKVSVSRVLWESDAIVAAAQSEVEMLGRFIWNVSNTSKNILNNIPTFPKTKILPNSDQVDRTDADVAAYIDMMELGVDVAATLYQPTDSEGRDINALAVATEAYAKKRKN